MRLRISNYSVNLIRDLALHGNLLFWGFWIT